MYDVEDCRQHGAERSKQTRREPDEPDGAVDREGAAPLDDFVENVRGGTGVARRMRGHELVDDLQHFRRSSIRRLIQEIDKTRRQEQKKRNRREQDVEGDAACEEKNVVLAAVVPDPLRVVAKQPTEPGREPALRH